MRGARRNTLEEYQAGSFDVEDISKGSLNVTEIESEETFDGGFEVWSDKRNHQQRSSIDPGADLAIGNTTNSDAY
jgi:hypothetical protein